MTGLAEVELGPLRLPLAYCPLEPTVKQEWFLRHDTFEAFFGGSAGPGKSYGLLMSAVQYVDVEGYHALLLRPALAEFEQPGGLIEVSHDWLDTSDAWWHGGRREWRFPSGASLRFGYLRAPGHLRQYKGPSYSFCGFDELTGFEEWAYRAMFRILRQEKGALRDVPLRMRSASNPGDVGHEWVKTRFVDPRSRRSGVAFVRATIKDNPYLDYETYLKSLEELDPVDRERLIRGDWDVTVEGGKFRRGDFVVVDEAPPAVRSVRYWDLAATEESQSSRDPDWTVGLRLDLNADGKFTVRDIVRGRWGDAEVEERLRETATADGSAVPVYVEQEPGASGKLVVGYIQRRVLHGFACHAGLTRGKNKEVRARPVAAAVGNGLVRVVRGQHLHEFLNETAIFPNGGHDDTVDAFSGAHYYLTRGGAGVASVRSTRARLPESRTAVPYRR